MANGAYIGIDGLAKKIKGGYVGVDGVARKIIKAYVGVDGVARLCWSSDAGSGGVPYAIGSRSVSSAKTAVTSISGLEFEPSYVFFFNPTTIPTGSYTYYNGVIGNVVLNTKTYGGAIDLYYGCEVLSDYGHTEGYSDYISLGARGSNMKTRYFTTGEYYYTVVGQGNGDNVLYGVKTTSTRGNTLTFDIGKGKTVKDVKVFFDGGGTYDESRYEDCTFGVYNNSVYCARAVPDNSDSYYTGNIYKTTKDYTVSDGVLTLNSYSSDYPFYEGNYYYCIVLE